MSLNLLCVLDMCHSEYSNDCSSPLDTRESLNGILAKTAVPPPDLEVRGQSENTYPLGVQLARTASSSFFSQVSVMAHTSILLVNM